MIGHTKIFMKTSGIQKIEDVRKQRFDRQVIIIQRFVRRFNSQKKLLGFIYEAIQKRKEAEEKKRREEEKARQQREERQRKEEEECKRKKKE